MNTVLFVNATIVFSVNLFLVAESRPPTIPRIFIFPFKIMYIICDYLTDISPKVPVRKHEFHDVLKQCIKHL